MVRFYDSVDRHELERIERKLAEVGIEYTVTPPQYGSTLPGSIDVAEEDLPRAEEILFATQHPTRH